MAILYFDASALVKLVVEEQGSSLAADVWDGCDAAVSSRLAYPEVCAALAAAGRNHDLDEKALSTCLQTWDRIWREMRAVELTDRVEQAAGLLAANRRLRGADAVHLASALEIGSPHLVMAVWDRRLHEGARAEGLAVVPQHLPA